MWLSNCWYVIAWEHEVPAAALFSRTILNTPIVLCRDQAGRIRALADRCPHRHAPLSLGRHEADGLRCGYHGLKVNFDGMCTEVPGIARAPANIRVRTFPVVSKNNWVFVWMGAEDAADEALLPDNFSNASPDWKNIPGYMHYETPYLLICDNLLDFSHLSYVHEKSLGGSTEIALAQPEIEQICSEGQRGVRVTRHIRNVPAPPFYQRFGSFDSNLDRWFIYDFLLPGTLLMHSGGRPTGNHPSDNSQAVQLHSCQTLTPETDTSTHYFFQQSHPTGQGDDRVRESIYNSLVAAFHEDREMITAQFRNLQLGSSEAMLPLHVDSALLQFRQLLEDACATEAALART